MTNHILIVVYLLGIHGRMRYSRRLLRVGEHGPSGEGHAAKVDLRKVVPHGHWTGIFFPLKADI